MILILGADAEETELLRTLLAGDFPLLVANTGQEALDLIGRHPVEVVLLDLDGSLQDTFDTLQTLLDLQEDLPVLLLADKRYRQEIKPLTDAGLTAYLEKPFTPSELKSKIQLISPALSEEPREALAPVLAPSSPPVPPVSGEVRTGADPVSTDRLIMDLAHRLKNPLVAIRTFAHLLKERFYDVQFQKDFYQTMSQEVERMDSLIDQLIEFSELPDPEIEGHGVLPMVEEAVRKTMEGSRHARIELRDRLGPGKTELPVDREQMIYALVNLFTGLAGGSARAKPGMVSVTLQKGADSKGIEILIQPAELRLEDPSHFFGLELFMAKRIIERQHGTIHWIAGPGGQAQLRIVQPLHLPASNPSNKFQKNHLGRALPAYPERRKRQVPISFKDRRTSQRRLRQPSPYIPERRRTLQATAQL